MRPAMVIAEVGTERSPGVALVAHDDVVQAVSAESADHSFTEGVRLRCSRRCGQQTRTEPSNAGTELAAVDGVSVVDDKARDLLRGGGPLDDARGIRRPLSSENILGSRCLRSRQSRRFSWG